MSGDASQKGVPTEPTAAKGLRVGENKVAVALAAREAMREHRRGQPVAFQLRRSAPRWRCLWCGWLNSSFDCRCLHCGGRA